MIEFASPEPDYQFARNVSCDELAALQLQRLQWSLNHAYDNVAHYRRRFEETGVHPGDLRSLEDLSRFPFSDKRDLRDNYPFGMLAVSTDEVVRVHASSGATGKPTVVAYTKNDIELWAAMIARSLLLGGARRQDRVLVSYGYGLFTGGLGAHYGAERLGCLVIPMSGGQTERQVQLIQDFEPDIIMATPSYVLIIADEFERQGLDARDTRLRMGVFGAEPWTNGMRKEIEERMALDALDHYGLSEVIGPGVAQECLETKDGPTVWEDHFYPEIIDPDSGEVLPEGEFGELVFTSLSKEALPVIRYRTRDRTRLLPGSACAMRRIEKITGRTDDMMIIRGVNVFPSQIEEQILKQPALSPHYVLELGRERHLDTLDVVVEMRPDAAGAGADGERAISEQLQHHIKSYIGISTRVRVVATGGVERSQGKAVRVIDKRKRR
jgi:phenylacetate-CoA ligase